MARRQDPAVWDQITKEWRKSTLTRQQFCEQQSIKTYQLDYQRKRSAINVLTGSIFSA